MLFNIAPTNAERVKKEFTATRPEHSHGYFQSVILTSPIRSYIYRVDMICGYYVLTVRNSREQVEIIANFEQYKPGVISVIKGELYKNGSGYPYRTEKSERYLKKYDQLACIVHGAIAAGLLFDMMKDEPTPATLPEAPTADETSTAGATSDATEKAPEEATTRPERPTTAESTTAGETPTTAETAPQDATSDAGSSITCTAAGNKITSDAGTAAGSIITPGTSAEENDPERPETSTPAQDTTGSDTRPPRAQEANQEPGHAAGDHSGQAADHITGATTGNTSGAAAEAITGRTTTTPQNHGHACENAPGRTERATAEQVHTPHAKRPPRAPQRATTHGRPRGHPEKTANFGRFYPLLDFPRTIFANFHGIPISVCIFGPVFDPEFWSPKPDPLGG